MCKVSLRCLWIVLWLLFATSNVLASDIWWSDANASNPLWSTPDNWWQLTVPVISDDAYVNRATYHCEIDSSVTALCNMLEVGYDHTSCFLDMNVGLRSGSITKSI